MNTKSLQSSYPKLFENMKARNYHEVTIARLHAEVLRILKYASSPDVLSYEDYYEKMYAPGKFGVPAWKSKQKWLDINAIKRFDYEGIFPDNQYHHCVSTPSAYKRIDGEFLALIDQMATEMKSREVKESTIKSSSDCMALFFLFIRDSYNVTSVKQISEDMVYSYFTEDGKIRFCAGSVNRIRRGLKDMKNHQQGKECLRVSRLIPNVKRFKRAYIGLSDENEHKVESFILAEDSDLSARDRAIMILLFYTGLRACDIAALKMENIDWVKKRIVFIQKKTGVEMSLKLEPIIGNSIYQYIKNERHKVDIPNIFLAADHHYRALNSGTISGICTRTMAKAGIDIKSCRTGAHVFRHKLATDLLEIKKSLPTISAVLGHIDPTSVQHYVGSTYTALKSCSISIADYPIEKYRTANEIN